MILSHLAFKIHSQKDIYQRWELSVSLLNCKLLLVYMFHSFEGVVCVCVCVYTGMCGVGAVAVFAALPSVCVDL